MSLLAKLFEAFQYESLKNSPTISQSDTDLLNKDSLTTLSTTFWECSPRSTDFLTPVHNYSMGHNDIVKLTLSPTFYLQNTWAQFIVTIVLKAIDKKGEFNLLTFVLTYFQLNNPFLLLST